MCRVMEMQSGLGMSEDDALCVGGIDFEGTVTRRMRMSDGDGNGEGRRSDGGGIYLECFCSLLIDVILTISRHVRVDMTSISSQCVASSIESTPLALLHTDGKFSIRFHHSPNEAPSRDAEPFFCRSESRSVLHDQYIYTAYPTSPERTSASLRGWWLICEEWLADSLVE